MGAEIILPGNHEGSRPAEEERRISLKDFLKTREADIGTIITGIKPIDLFTYQSWLDDTKIANVLNYAEMESPELNQITGYIQYHPKFEKNIMVIGNGNHRALYAIAMGRTIDLAIEKPVIVHKENPFRLTNVIKKHGNPFVNL